MSVESRREFNRGGYVVQFTQLHKKSGHMVTVGWDRCSSLLAPGRAPCPCYSSISISIHTLIASYGIPRTFFMMVGCFSRFWCCGKPPSPSDEGVETRGLPSGEAVETRVLPSDEAVETRVLPSDEAVETRVLPSDEAVETRVLPSDEAVETRVLPSDEAVFPPRGEGEPSQCFISDAWNKSNNINTVDCLILYGHGPALGHPPFLPQTP
ncbi:hypothetical protein EDC04DRAFT_799635 [Pisolithus marmoratus]|nr:hypothetical protein EDC04DRAFT_799635 [Pisolithus marmoratus]